MNLDYDVVVYLDPWEFTWLELRSCLKKCNYLESPRIILSSGGGNAKFCKTICLAA